MWKFLQVFVCRCTQGNGVNGWTPAEHTEQAVADMLIMPIGH